MFIVKIHNLEEKLCVVVCVNVVAQSCLTHCDPMAGLFLARLLCPWASPGKNTGVGWHSLLQGILNSHFLNLPHWQVDSLPMHHLRGHINSHMDKTQAVVRY